MSLRDELREKRNGRITSAISANVESTNRNDPHINTTNGTDEETASRSSGIVERSNGRVESNKSGSYSEFERVRQAIGRFNRDSGSSIENSVKNKIAEKMSKAFAPKDTKETKETKKIAPVFSDRDVVDKQLKLEKALERYFEYLDQYLWERSGDTTCKPIWSNADEEELSCIARTFLIFAKKDATVAKVVDYVLEGNYIATTAIFFSTRIYKSVPIIIGKK